jgi:hypothetical protein
VIAVCTPTHAARASTYHPSRVAAPTRRKSCQAVFIDSNKKHCTNAQEVVLEPSRFVTALTSIDAIVAKRVEHPRERSGGSAGAACKLGRDEAEDQRGVS